MSAENNGGHVKNWFTPVTGISTSNMSATATAVMASPGTALPGAFLPLVTGQAAANEGSTYNSSSGLSFGNLDLFFKALGNGVNGWTSIRLPAASCQRGICGLPLPIEAVSPLQFHSLRICLLVRVALPALTIVRFPLPNW